MRVMADGCFDPIHEGHVAYFEAARALGDTLVVNVAPDADLWRKRPEVGPLLPVASRAALIKALKPVDEVVTMDTPEALRRLSPDIYAKGKDWEGHLAADEEQICREMGIRVCFLDTVENSSTALLQAFLQRWDAYRGSDAIRDGE